MHHLKLDNCCDVCYDKYDSNWGTPGERCMIYNRYNGGIQLKRRSLCFVIIAALMMTFSIGICGFAGFPVYSDEKKSVSYVKTIYNEQNGLPTGEANTIIQTSDGYIWIGSYGGLIRYDGSSFRNYSTDGSISSSSIRSLFEDSRGRLWIGTNDAGVYVYEQGEFVSINSPGDYSFLCIRDFAEDPQGKIYIASTSGMGEINGSDVVVYDDDRLFNETVYSIACDPLGRVWAAMNSGKCAVVSDGNVTELVEPSSVFEDAEIYCVEADKNGKMYLGSSTDQLAVLTFDESGSYSENVFSAGLISTHNSIKVADDGTMIVCGEHGFALMDQQGNIIMTDDTDQSMPTNDAVIDYEGNIWFASSTYGAIKYTVGCIDAFGDNTEISELAINAVTEADGKFYAVHDNGVSIITADGEAVSNELTKMLDGVRIRHVMTDSSGRVWLSTYSEHGAVCYDPKNGRIEEYDQENGLINNRVRMILELSDGSFAVATQEGISIIDDGKVTVSYGSEDGLSVSAILCLAQDKDGTLYMGSDGGGIYALRDGVIANHGFEEKLEEGVVLRMIADSSSDGYFVSAGSNLYYWDKQIFKKLENFKKGAGSIFDFMDHDGKLWLLQNNGMIALNKEKLLSGEFTDETEYSFASGLTGSLNANTWNYLDSSGTLYISTRKGISVFRFSDPAATLPKVSINSTVVDTNVYESPSKVNVPGNTQRITIDFAALSFSGNPDFTISYKLEGFDDAETVLPNTASGTISYTNLPGGTYKFVVRVYDPEKPQEASTCSLELIKAKRLYEYPLFWGIIALAFILLVMGVMYMISSVRVKAARRRQEEYQHIVEQSLRTFAETIDAKDKYTTGHSLRVAAYSRELAKRMGMSEEEQERIYYIALLHDIGKIGVPDSILNKPGKLTQEEMEVIRTHPVIGGKILENFTAIKGISEGAKYHHERYDGNGYCEKKAGLDIPLEARIIGVADTYDAMSSTRCYRKALSSDVIEEELKRVSGTQLDPEIVPHMLDMINDGSAPIRLESQNIDELKTV